MDHPIIKRITLDRTSPVPLYYQIEAEFQRLLDSGVLQPGDKMPGDWELCAALGVNRGTVRQAIARLVRAGRVVRRKRAGTFVRQLPDSAPPSIGFFYFFESATRMLMRAELIQRHCSKVGFDLKLVPFPADYYDRVDLLAEVRRRALRGAILVPILNDSCHEQLRRLEAARFPYVRMGNKCFTGQLTSPLVTGDDRSATRMVLERLWNLGHRRIGMVTKHDWCEPTDEYRVFMRERNAFHPEWLEITEFGGTLEGWKRFPAARFACGYLRDHPELTAIVSEHSGMGIELNRQVHESGRRVPDDLSVVTLDNDPALDATTPPLSSTCVSDEEEAEVASRILIDLIRDGTRTTEEVHRVAYAFIDRASVAPPPASA